MGLGMPPFNGKDDRYGSDREDDGELGSDAENDDMSDNEDIASSNGTSAAPQATPAPLPVDH